MDNQEVIFKTSLIYLYRYFIKLKTIIIKLRGKSRGRFGQLTDEEMCFIEPIIKNSYLNIDNKD